MRPSPLLNPLKSLVVSAVFCFFIPFFPPNPYFESLNSLLFLLPPPPFRSFPPLCFAFPPDLSHGETPARLFFLDVSDSFPFSNDKPMSPP
ncbi:hypothetical protein HanPSC8_Chr05g0203701 [Helianthus annuus]|nr:hypothetical protein HanPSC8_Chr05g0203701 [Helianthus annuus]